MSTKTEPSLFIIFGGTGDLSRRKLLPALAQIWVEGHLNERFRVVVVGRSPKSDEEFRNVARQSLADVGMPQADIDRSVSHIHYHALGEGTDDDYRGLATRLADLGRDADIPPNHAFYRSLPPRAFNSTAGGLGVAGLKDETHGWTRLVVEKPFGTGLASAQELNRQIHDHFTENQIYRIDHYLGKETVQNLLVFRLANAFIESSWNRDRIEAVQITVSEHLGVGTRAEYYDHSGALRDMVQNHITQLLTLVALQLFIDSWRWQGVPFYVRTGKCMPHKSTQIAIRFREAPISFFQRMGCSADTHDVLTITLQPNGGFSFYLDIKQPGSPLRLERIPLKFNYDQHFAQTMPDSYQTLLLDVLKGDQTLFVHADEVEESWSVYRPILENPPKACDYVAGTWGPPGANHLAIPEADLWQRKRV